MDPLFTIAGILVLFGLLMFSIRLMIYNRRKYGTDHIEHVHGEPYSGANLTIRMVAFVVLLIALLILYFFS